MAFHFDSRSLRQAGGQAFDVLICIKCSPCRVIRGRKCLSSFDRSRRPEGEFGGLTGTGPQIQGLNPYGYNLFSRAGTESVSTGERMPGTVLEKFLIGVFNPILV